MLPDFPEFKRQFWLALDDLVRTQAESGTLLRMPKRTRHFEGSRHSAAGDAAELPYQRAEGLLTLSLKDIVEGGPEVVLARAVEAGTEMREHAEKHLMQVIQDAAHQGRAGMSLSQGPITPESVLDACEAADMSFDSAGHPNFVMVGGSRETLQALKECQREISENPEYERRARAIFDRKHREWVSRKGNRSLAE